MDINWAKQDGKIDFYGFRPLISGRDRIIIVEKKDLGDFPQKYLLIVMHGNEAISQHVDEFETMEEAYEMLRLTVSQRYLENAVWKDAGVDWVNLKSELNTKDEKTRKSFRDLLLGRFRK